MHQPVKTFSENSNSPDHLRPEYAKMLDSMRDPRSQFLVVIPDARHLGDDLESVVSSLLELDSVSAAITCMDDNYPDPIQNAFQTLQIKGVSKTRSQRIKESMRIRASRGQALGKPLYGYRIGEEGKLEINVSEAKVVELVFRLYTMENLGLRLIVEHLNERGITTRRGGNWNTASVREILKNPSYIGTYTRFGMRVPKAHEPIINPEIFHSAQDITRSRRPIGRVAKPEPFLLSGLLFCGDCGNKMMGVTRRQSWKRRDGRRSQQTYRYYQCQSKNNQSVCKYHTWRASMLETNIVSQLKLTLPLRSNSNVSESVLDRARTLRIEKLKNAERRFLRAARRVARGEMSIGKLGTYLTDLTTARQATLENRVNEDSQAILDNWKNFDMDRQRVFLSEHVAKIIVSDESVDVVL
ncbi:recombinase family protein [Dehalococcoidia bacterium]|nr:recombinase family protein [Dehalococcoidia bacterium]